jgi:hypothetical protein
MRSSHSYRSYVSSRIGSRSVSAMLKSNRYNVAMASCNPSPKLTAKGYLPIKMDLLDPYSFADVFETLQKEFGESASVVVHNGIHFV